MDPQKEKQTALPNTELAIPEGVSLSPTALTLPANLSEEDWSIVGTLLARSEEGLSWAKADWWAYGSDSNYGKSVSVAERFGWSPQTLKNAGVVARSIPAVRRSATLSFAHHAEVASLTEEEQTTFLAEAASSGLTVRELRRRVRGFPEPQSSNANDVLQKQEGTDETSEGVGNGVAGVSSDRLQTAGDISSSWSKEETVEERAIELVRSAAELLEQATGLIQRPAFRLTVAVGQELNAAAATAAAAITALLQEVQAEVGSIINVNSYEVL